MRPESQGYDGLVVTPENTHWSMNFVLGVVLKFQTIPRPSDVWGRYRVRAKSGCQIVDGEGNQVAYFAAGAVIADATFCDHFKVGETWMWEDGGQRKFVRVSECEILDERRHSFLAREARRQHFANRSDADGR
jgi:hypothetical protein